MQFLRKILDEKAKMFEKGGKLEKFYAIFEMHDTILFTPGEVTKGRTHIRDGIDLKRTMITVVMALVPCILMSIWNSGHQANLAIVSGNAEATAYVAMVFEMLGLGYAGCLSDIIHGALLFIPLLAVSYIVGGIWEVVFAVIRGHEVTEGFLVTGMLIPLCMPPTVPLWQLALGVSFGVVIGKEVFGGVGMNILNPALTARAFLFFAYPAEMSGDKVWVSAYQPLADGGVDAMSSATPLAYAALEGTAGVEANFAWMDALLGVIPGSMGETSVLACLLGAALLIGTGIGSWRIMLSCVMGLFVCNSIFSMMSAETNPMMDLPFHWHLVLGGFAFGTVFMATDPVSASMTQSGKWVYGFLIGFLCCMIRTVNPAYPEGMMLAILLVNVFAPLIDHVVVSRNIKRRRYRNAA